MSTPTPEYIDFVKKFLVNRCIIEFMNQFYENPEYSDKSEILLSIDDVNLWGEVYFQIYPLFDYYSMLISESNSTFLYEQNRLVNVFELPTFQEYLNNLIQYTIHDSDLKKFNDNMKIKSFHENLNKKYDEHIKTNTLLNHLIYLVKLYLSNQTTQTTETKQKKYLTPTEENDLDLMINAIPYFEYVSHIDESDETIEQIETEGLKYIQKYMLGLVDNQ
jgi:hypothetical protein